MSTFYAKIVRELGSQVASFLMSAFVKVIPISKPILLFCPVFCLVKVKSHWAYVFPFQFCIIQYNPILGFTTSPTHPPGISYIMYRNYHTYMYGLGEFNNMGNAGRGVILYIRMILFVFIFCSLICLHTRISNKFVILSFLYFAKAPSGVCHPTIPCNTV